MAKGGTITGKQLITDEGINRPLELKKNLQKVIDKTEELIKVAIKFNKISSSYKGAKTEKEFLKIKKEDIALTKTAIKIEKEKNAASLQAQKIKTEILRTEKLALEIERKKLDIKKKNTKLTISERVQLQANNKQKKLEARTTLGLVDAYEKLNTKRNEAQRKLANLLSAEKKNVKQIKVAQQQYKILDKRIKEVDRSTKNYSKNVGNYKSAIGGLTGSLRGLVSALGLMGGAMAFVSVMRNGIRVVRDFGATMATLAGIYRVSRKDLAELEEKIISVAGSSVKTATEVAKLAETLATLGKSKEEIQELLEPVNNLSIGLKATSDETAEFLVQTINAFGGSSDEAEKYADIIATIRTSTSLNFQKMRDSFQYLTPISRILNKDLAYTGALIGLLADNGVKAERAGRILGTAQQKLAKESKTLAGALHEVNEASKRGIKEEKLLAVASKLFGKQAASLGIILAQNSEKIDVNAEAIRNNGGALDDLVNEQLTSLDAHLLILKSRWEEYILNANKSSKASNGLKNVLKFLSDNLKTIVDVVIILTGVFIVWKGLVIAANLIMRVYTAATIALRIAKIGLSGGIKRATIAFKLFSKAVKISPLGIFLTLLAGAIFLFKKYNKSLLETVQKTKESTEEFLQQRKSAKESNIELSKLITRHDELKTKTELSNVEQIELNRIIKEIAKHTPDAVTEIDKYGDAIGISTKKVKGLLKLQEEVSSLETSLQIKEEEKALKKLEEALSLYKKIDKEGDAVRIKGLGNIKKQGDALVKVSTYMTSSNISISKNIKLTEKQTLAYKKSRLAIENSVTATKERISELDGTAQAKRVKAEIKAEKERKAAEKLRIEKAKELAKKLKEAEDAAKWAEGAEKRKKEREKRAREQATLEKKLQGDALKLAKSRIEQEINLNDELSKNEEENAIERINAINERTNAEKKLIDEQIKYDLSAFGEYSEEKLKFIQDFTKEEIEDLMAGNFVKKQLTDEQLLVLEQYFEKKKEIQEKNKSDIEEISKSDSFEKEMNEKINEEKKALLKSLDATETTEEDRAKLIEDSERKIAGIRRKYAMQGLKDQLKALDDLIKQEEDGSKLRVKFEAEAAELKGKILSLEIQEYKDKEDDKTDKIKLSLKDILEESQKVARALSDLGNAIFDSKIQKIDEEIEKNEEYYNRQIELAGDDEVKKALIQEQAEKKRKVLEKKKREEQRKQAILNKAMAAVEVAIATSLAVIRALAHFPGIPETIPNGVLAGVLGAIQLAAVLAKPIPKYVKGTDYHKGGLALVGEERPEVITEPNRSPYVVNKPSVLDLPASTIVTPSLDEYERLFKNSIFTSINNENKKLKTFQSLQYVNDNKELVKEMQLTREAFKKQKQPIVFHERKIDIEHAVWKQNNVDW